ncbi:MAG: hypothetical protein ACU0CC_15560 [Sagittula sp.]|jgi:uncharacterized protein YjiS (DUF1127 family)|uniref:hypothetical protein n=1 Tax=unclassified Sagittula TaxID=2624628 RepID=UPI0020C7B82B|nr:MULTISPECIES: hypothetical protein [unclassified Sagittula]WHZ36880.1 hypothetical protein QNI11_07640 [Sagittula sp. MA-2]
MTAIDMMSVHTTGSTLRQRLARMFETPFDRRYRQRTATIAALRAKSDADLAAMGLTRDEIVPHVFRGRAVI